jgi:hypothetical protein
VIRATCKERTGRIGNRERGKLERKGAEKEEERRKRKKERGKGQRRKIQMTKEISLLSRKSR